MSHWDKSTFAGDLSKFLALLVKYEVPVDASTIYSLESNFLYTKDYCVDIKDVVFLVDSKIAGTIPHHITKISIYFEHFCDFDLAKNTDTEDPIKSTYTFGLKIIGYSDQEEYSNFWHLDQDQKGNNGHKVSHPYYHFHSGGEELNGCETGKIIFMTAPRLAHPPMDLFLGFHFVINNFYNSKQYDFVNKLMEDEDYQDIIGRSQQRLWEPYFNSFSPATTHTHYTFTNVFPLFLKN